MAEDRVALVIGNGDYVGAPLTNPTNDASDMREALTKVGFSVIYEENADLPTMDKAVREFTRRLNKNTTGLFYFSGHGVQVDGRNFLVPTSASVQTKSELIARAYDAAIILGNMEEVGNRVSIIILDACRNNPFNRGFRSISKGLASMSGPKGSLIAFATAPNDTAEDGGGRNGTYTKQLLHYITQPGITIEEMFRLVRNEVSKETNNDQIPWETSSLMGDRFCFAGCGNVSYPSLVSTPHLSAKPATVTPIPIMPPSRSGNTEPEMVTIKGGCFIMGSSDSEESSGFNDQQHRVCVNDFAIGKYEVTFEEYDRFCEMTGHKKPDDEGWGRGKRPVIKVSWFDAVAYTDWLSQQTGKRYRLPTEAEWEYAARAGTQTAYWWGNTFDNNKVNGNDAVHKTTLVGQYPANPWGLYDMIGNVWEWTCSVYEQTYSGNEKICSGKKYLWINVLRGGSWLVTPVGLRSAYRFERRPDARSNNIGFRAAKTF